MSHSRILSDLGGHSAVARALGVSNAVAWRWGKHRCIPPGRWSAIVELAHRQGATHITLQTLLAGYAPAQRPSGGAMAAESRA
jgi:DNA-binding transcriptional regulator YdaS (Cro superfamily)